MYILAVQKNPGERDLLFPKTSSEFSGLHSFVSLAHLEAIVMARGGGAAQPGLCCIPIAEWGLGGVEKGGGLGADQIHTDNCWRRREEWLANGK